MSKTYAIHPAIGVSRIGNLPVDLNDSSTYYLAPESPGELPNYNKNYKANGQVKKQAQRFRIYEFDHGVALREITLSEADVTSIVWSVQLVNRKAALKNSDQINGHTPGYHPCGTRNSGVSNRSTLVIDSGQHKVGTGQSSSTTLSGQISFPYNGSTKTKTVVLGVAAAESGTGRLLMFGGNGISEGLDGSGNFSPNASTNSTFNNNNWYDDLSDGIVQAAITVGGSTIHLNTPQETARVIAGVPGFAPDIQNFASLYDVALSAVADIGNIGRPSFAQDIYPILASPVMCQWTSLMAAIGHANGKNGDFLSVANMALLGDNNPDPGSNSYKRRNAVFSRVRPPSGVDTPVQNMPDLNDNAAVTKLQYAQLTAWRDGGFKADGEPIYTPLQYMPVAMQPAALDRASLATTCGGPFYPGIESWNVMAENWLYDQTGGNTKPLRVAAGVEAGQLTIGNALPWQTDYIACGTGWWPAQRPNQVWVKSGEHGVSAGVPWIPNGFKMITDWFQLGFVVQQGEYYLDTEAGDTVPNQRRENLLVISPPNV